MKQQQVAFEVYIKKGIRPTKWISHFRFDFSQWFYCMQRKGM